MFIIRLAKVSKWQADRMVNNCDKKIDKYERKIAILKNNRDWAQQSSEAFSEFISAANAGDCCSSMYDDHIQHALRKLVEDLPPIEDVQHRRFHLVHKAA